ncbi:hypothetical protein LTR08_008684 [Meristemomyces frigidus]|nr:hypothetical protein LTR08_008684 [Meristemomyces frigidus]
MALLEVACFDPKHAILAFEAGADRIELCENREAGGTTPPLVWLTSIKSRITVPILVMIRPRGGDFDYSDAEYEQMKTAIEVFKPFADGYVFGILDQDRKVHVAKNVELVRLAHPLPCTFHRAFDETPDPFEAFEDVSSAGFRAILSSGCAATASAGNQILAQLVEMSNGTRERITVMPGGGVRSKNIAAMKAYTRATIFHSAGILEGMASPSADEIRGMKHLLRTPITSLPPPMSC